MTRKQHARLFYAGAAVLAVLHVAQPGFALSADVAGLPADMVYHLVWMALAWALVLHLVLKVWPVEEVVEP